MCDNIVVIATLVLSFISTIFVGAIFYIIYKEFRNHPVTPDKVEPRL